MHGFSFYGDADFFCIGVFVHGIDACAIGCVIFVAFVFVVAYGQERYDDDGNGQVAAVAVAVFDDVGQADDGDGHGYDDNGQCDDTGTNDGAVRDAFQRFGFREASRKAEYGRNAGRNQA